jgi:hypothetical protein
VNGSIELLAVVGTTLALGIVAVRGAEGERMRRSLVAYQLRFPRGLDSALVRNFLSGITGMLPPWWHRWLVSPFIVVETVADNVGITHRLLVPAAWAAVVENVLQSSLPGVRYEQVTLPTSRASTGAAYRLSSSSRALRVDATALSSRLLTSLQPLKNGESIVVQWVVSAAGPVAPPRVIKKGESNWLGSPRGSVADTEAATALKAKQAHALLLAEPRVVVEAGSEPRRRHLLRQVEVAWHGTRAPGVHLRRRVRPAKSVVRNVVDRRAPLAVWPSTFNAEELSGLIGWPIDASSIPGLVLGGCRQIAASPLVVRSGTVVADSNFPGDARPLALDEQGRLRHVHVVGPTGTGKSTLLVNMAVQDIEAGLGVVLLDPKGDLAADVLDRIPAPRKRDVIVLDPADEERPVGLNPLRAADGASAEVVVENLVGLFKSLYRSSWGPRTDDVLRAALMTLAASGDATLCEVPLLLTDPTYRRRLVGKLDDPIGLESFWGWYEALSDGERLTVVGPVLNKVRAFSMRPRVRSIIGQADPALDLRKVLANGQILIVSLASGLLGEEAAALLGALVIAELWHATTARSGMSASRRRPVMAYLDEWQHFLHLPTPMASVLAEARGLGLGMTLAHQHLGQLPESARDSVLSNARSRVIFQLPAGDARLLTKELSGLLTADDLQGLGAYEVVTQLFAAGSTQPAATGRTRPMVAALGSGDDVRARSSERFGVPRSDVEHAIRTRSDKSKPNDAVGRRRDGGTR